MPLEVSCPSCSGNFRLPDAAAGKKIRCPKCKGAIEVPLGPVPAESPPALPSPVESPPARPTEVIVATPAPSLLPPTPLPAPKLPPPALPLAPAKPPPAADEWYLQTADGEEYGPASRAELDGWLDEGRITADCQLLRGGEAQWQWAADVFPQLDEPAEEAEQEPAAPAPARPSRFKDPPPAKNPAPAVKNQKPVGKKPERKKPSVSKAADDQDYSQRSRLVAGFLGIFLGPLGIHRFYLGYWGVGLAMLFTGGGLFFWSLIDAIFVMTGRVPDADGRPLSD